MKRMFLGITSLLFTSVVISGCSNLLDDGTVKVLSHDVKAETELQENELKVIKNDRLQITETVEYNGLAHQSLFFNENGATYRLNPITNEKEKIADIEFYDISQHGNKALAKASQTFFVLDLTTGDRKEIGTGGEEYEYYFADADGKEVIYVEDAVDDSRKIHLINSETAKRMTWKIDDTFDFNGFTITGVKKGKEGIYTVLKKKDGKIGLYELRLDGEIKLVNELKDFDHFSTFDFLTEDKIIFNDIYNGISGIYTLDLVTNEIVQLVAGGEDKEGIWFPFYLLSPDKTKMLFDVPVQVGKEYKTNVYVGELVGNKLINISSVMTAADLYAVISGSAVWSNDSQEVYIATNQEQKSTIETIEVFQITK